MGCTKYVRLCLAARSAARASAASFSAYGKRPSSLRLLLKTPHSIRLRTMTFTFDRLGLAAAFFLPSLAFFFSPGPASPAAVFPCFSAASACSRSSLMFRVLLPMDDWLLLKSPAKNPRQTFPRRTGRYHSDDAAEWLLWR